MHNSFESDLPEGAATKSAPRTPLFEFGSGRQIVFAFAVPILNVVTMMALAFGIVVPRFLKDQREFLTGSFRELLACAFFLLFAIAFVRLVIGRMGGVSMRELGWDSSHLKEDLALGLLGHLCTQLTFVGAMYARDDTIANYWSTLRGFSSGRHLQTIIIGLQAAFME